MGSGTTPLVAAMWGRKGIGIELNKLHYEAAKKRIVDAKIPYLKEDKEE
jgi:DNA modification methylase